VKVQLLKHMIESQRRDDERGFVDAVQKLIAAERQQGHTRTADELQRSLDETQRRNPTPKAGAAGAVYELPLARSEALSFVEVRESDKTLDDIVMAGETAPHVMRFLEEYSHRAALRAHGLQPLRKVLFHGPPGNGKTLCAEVIAGELGLPLFYVRFDALIASHLGETAANLRKVFELVRRQRVVLFFDEVDAIARTRDVSDDVGEIKRVVNSLLQLLDGDVSEGPIIAATNHERALDDAIWRRFDDVVYFPQPGAEERLRYLSRRLRAVRTRNIALGPIVEACEGMSLSDLARIATDALKSMVLAGDDALTGPLVDAAVEKMRRARANRARIA
jgi:SpoVK/Ycf46/Vps4 family AAA+-type ATPase